MLTKDHAQELLSRAYVQAVAAAARVNIKMESAFDYGFDGQFDSVAIRVGQDGDGKPVNRHINEGFPIDFQLKCSWKWTADATDITWSIKTKTYNDLVTRPAEAVPAILILMCLPPNEADWLTLTEESVLLRKCCYFAKLSGPAAETETSTKQIKIPRTSVLNAANLTSLLAAEKSRRLGMF